MASRLTSLPAPSAAAVAEIAPKGILRAAINLSNFLLVTGEGEQGEPAGVSPDMAAALAAKLEVPLHLIPFASPGEVADAALKDVWDIGNIGAEAQRARTIQFTAPYTEIESTFLVPADSPLTTPEDANASGVRVAVCARTAYDLYLERNYTHCELVRASTIEESFELYAKGGLDALAGLRPRLVDDIERLPAGSARILAGRFSAVNQAIGIPKRSERHKSSSAISDGDELLAPGAAYVRDFVEVAKSSGLVAELIEKHGVVGKLAVAPLAPAASL